MFLGALTIVVAALVTSQSDQTAYVEDSMRPQYDVRRHAPETIFSPIIQSNAGVAQHTQRRVVAVHFLTRAQYARHGHDGVDLRRAATDMQCSDIRSGIMRSLGDDSSVSLDELRAQTTYLVRADELPCVCAPALGAPRRYAVLNLGVDTQLVHAYNARIDREWDGSLDGGERLDVEAASLVRENQRMLFPERSESVDVVRSNAVRLRYQDEECRARSLILRDEHAWCMQACDDLFDGRSVYDVAVDAADVAE